MKDKNNNVAFNELTLFILLGFRQWRIINQHIKTFLVPLSGGAFLSRRKRQRTKFLRVGKLADDVQEPIL